MITPTYRLAVAFCTLLWAATGALAHCADSVTATVKNGTYAGIHNSFYNQDFFLVDAKNYSPQCVGYGVDDLGYEVSEDCLTLNVIRPSGYENSSLPVLVWIHGGGYVMGGSADERYNLTFIVRNSIILGKPIVAVSLQYRLSAFGFLAGTTIKNAGLSNLGLRDQRLALHWIQENIAAFGGDPMKVTIWGESAGGGSVGYQAQAYGGRDDGLFRAIIAESSWEFPGTSNTTLGDLQYNSITAATACDKSPDSLDCLRAVPFDVLNRALNTTPPFSFGPVVDGDFVPDVSSRMLDAGRFTKVPLLIGSNTDEGTTFGPRHISNDSEFSLLVSSLGPDATTTQVFEYLYPDIPAIGIPETLHGRPNDASYGIQYKRSSAFAGDYSIQAPRRARNQAWSKYNASSYSYRFNVLVSGLSEYAGSNHFHEFAFVVDNLEGLGYGKNPAYPVNPFAGKPPSYAELASLMSRMWISFVHDLDPNNHGVLGIPHWPIYNAADGYGENFVFDANVTSYVEDDTFRAEAIAFRNQVAASQFHR